MKGYLANDHPDQIKGEAKDFLRLTNTLFTLLPHIVNHIVNHIVAHIVDQHILTVSSYSGLTALSQATESSSHKTNHLTSPVALFTVVTFFLFRDFADAFNKALKFRSNYNPSTNLHIFICVTRSS